MFTMSPANRYSKSGDEMLSCSMNGYEGLDRGGEYVEMYSGQILNGK